MGGTVYFLAVWLATAGVLFAQQISVELITNQDIYLPNEALRVGVKISNRSGQPVIFGDDGAWAQFSIMGSDKLPLGKTGDPAPGEIFVLANASQITRWFDLSPHFDLGTPGTFTVSTAVRVKQWGETFTGTVKRFDIVRGVNMAEIPFGVASRQSSGIPEGRKYILQKVRDTREARLYLRVISDDGLKIYNVLPLGVLISLSKPEYQADQHGRFHALFQTGSRYFTYCLASPDGQMIQRHIYEYTQKKPTLGLDENGRTIVKNGVRKPTPDDFPALPPRAPLPLPRRSDR